MRKTPVSSWITFSITFDINGNKDIGLLLDASVKEHFWYIGFSFESGNFPEKIERLYKSVIGLAKTSGPSFKKRSDRLSELAVLDTLVFFWNI